MNALRTFALCLVVVLGASACNKLGPELAASSPSPTPTIEIEEGSEAWPTPTPTKMSRAERWAKRFWHTWIPLDEAVARLQPHVDVPVVMPDLNRRWRAQPRYLDWHCQDGFCSGRAYLRTRTQILIVEWGRSGFDGCGGDRAIPTRVGNQPALLNISLVKPPSNYWSTVIWPATPGDRSGRYGLTGDFEPFQLINLAESMEAARLEALRERSGGC